MCGLAGVILKNKKRSDSELKTIADNFQQMLLEADTRGGHATGFAIIDSRGDYLIHKTNKDAFDFLDTEDSVTALDLVSTNATCIMGHTRYATLGSPNINKNNHPIRTGKTIGTHNGSIHNHKELFKKYNMKRFAQVDSEAIFRLYETSDSLKEFAENRLPNVRGRVSIVWADLEYPEYIYMVKGDNPLELAYIEDLDIYVYGSTTDIIKAGGWNKIQRLNVDPYTMLRVNTNTFRIRTKKIEIQKPIPKVYSNYRYDSNIGVYKKIPHINSVVKKSKYENTVSNFVPRFSYKDQQELFKKYKCNDGSTIKKVGK